MRLSSYFKFRLPEGSDVVNVEDFNANFEEIDAKLNDVANKAGDVSKGTVFAEAAGSRANLASGDTMATIVGKLMRWLSDLGAAAFCKVANNDITDADGYVADARVLKTHKGTLDKHEEELGGLYFGTDGNGKWGYKTSKNGAVTAFRKPAGNASVGDVLSGKTFANASNDSLTGTMTNRGAWTGETTGNGNVAIPAGYHNGSGYVSGAGAYNAGVEAGKAVKPFIYTFGAGTYHLGDPSKPYYVKNYSKLTAADFYGACSWSVHANFHHTDTADHSYDDSGAVTFSYDPLTAILQVSVNNVTSAGITLVCPAGL